MSQLLHFVCINLFVVVRVNVVNSGILVHHHQKFIKVVFIDKLGLCQPDVLSAGEPALEPAAGVPAAV